MGPYNISYNSFPQAEHKIIDDVADAHFLSEDHPSIYTDMLDADGDLRPDTIEATEIFSACPSVEQLRVWFEPFFNDLLRIGFRVYKINLREGLFTVGRSGKQVGYCKAAVISKEELSIEII